jgi:hypothetical protein
MKQGGYKLLVVGLLILGIMLAAGGPAMADLKVMVFCPNFQNNVQFNITLKVYNADSKASFSFNRVVVASLNPDLTISGPRLVSSVARTVLHGQTITFTVPYKINTTAPGGTLAPVLVTLWNTYYTAGYGRGAGGGAAYKTP